MLSRTPAVNKKLQIETREFVARPDARVDVTLAEPDRQLAAGHLLEPEAEEHVREEQDLRVLRDRLHRHPRRAVGQLLCEVEHARAELDCLKRFEETLERHRVMTREQMDALSDDPDEMQRYVVGLHFQMHYTTMGKETTDVTQVGFYTLKAPPQYIKRSTVISSAYCASRGALSTPAEPIQPSASSVRTA